MMSFFYLSRKVSLCNLRLRFSCNVFDVDHLWIFKPILLYLFWCIYNMFIIIIVICKFGHFISSLLVLNYFDGSIYVYIIFVILWIWTGVGLLWSCTNFWTIIWITFLWIGMLSMSLCGLFCTFFFIEFLIDL